MLGFNGYDFLSKSKASHGKVDNSSSLDGPVWTCWSGNRIAQFYPEQGVVTSFTLDHLLNAWEGMDNGGWLAYIKFEFEGACFSVTSSLC